MTTGARRSAVAVAAAFVGRCALALFWGCALTLPGGCAVGPDFEPPAAPATTGYTAAPLAPVAGQRLVEGRDIPADWWGVFRSAPLDGLMRRALSANPDLQAAEAALRAAREAVLAQRGAGFPSVAAGYSGTRGSVADPVASPLESGASIYSLHTAQLSISYLPDVFGGNRRQVESLAAQAEAQRAQLEAARLTLASNLVQAVVQRAATRAQRSASLRTIELAGRQLALLQRQQALGQIGAGDVAAEEAALAQLQATLPPLDKQEAQLTDQLAALSGRLPSEADLPAIELADLVLPGELPLSLPARLVEQRPDIRAARAQWQAAYAQIGVAVANRLPSVDLTASFGSSALRATDLFKAGTGFWTLAAGVAQPIFDAGSLRHRQGVAEAAAAQAEAQYRSTVLLAFRNVADTLQAIEADARTLDADRAAEQAARRSLQVAERQRSAGLVGALPVLVAEQAWQQATLARIQAEADRLVDAAALFQALGSGWWNRGDAGAAGEVPSPGR